MWRQTRWVPLYLFALAVPACSDTPSAPVQDAKRPAAAVVSAGYTLSDLGAPLPCAAGSAMGINEAGNIIVGYTCNEATVWQDNGPPVTLGMLPGASWSAASAVNDSGQIVGGSGPLPFMTDAEAFLYTPADGLLSIHDSALFTESYALAINNAGVVVGFGKTAGGAFRGFRWTAADGMHALPLNNTVARDINDLGTITGYTTGTYYKNGVIWSGPLALLIGTMGGDYSVADGINDAGHVVGLSLIDDSDTGHAFMYSPLPFTKPFSDLGPASSPRSRGHKISDQGRVVGFSGPAPVHAITWYLGAFSYLPDFGALSAAYDVSRCGTIVGYAYTSGGELQRPVRWNKRMSDCAHR